MHFNRGIANSLNAGAFACKQARTHHLRLLSIRSQARYNLFTIEKGDQKTMNIIESYNLQKDKENKDSYSNTYTNELNTYFSNYINTKKKLRELQEQKQLESELIQNINNAIEKTFK